MKKSILFGISLGMIVIALSSCGLVGVNLSSDSDGTLLSEAIGRRDMAGVISLNPAFEQMYNRYANSDEKKKKVMAFAADMLGNMEKREPGSSIILLHMVSSKDSKLVEMAVESAIKKFDEEVLVYAGTLDPGKVFQKIFNEY